MGKKKTYNNKPVDQVSLLKPDLEQRLRFRLDCVDPLDAKYGEKVYPLVKDCLSHGAELRGNSYLQYILLETLGDYGKIKTRDVKKAKQALDKIDELNIHLLEEQVTQHDQLAVIVEYSRHISERLAAFMHPGTTSYDIVDSTRAYLFSKAWKEYLKPECKKLIKSLTDLAEEYNDTVQIGRTHLQYTSPILFGGYLSSIARRLAEAYLDIDRSFKELKGKISGIVGTGAGVEQFVGKGEDIEFEADVLKKLGLEPEYCMSQTTSKESYLKIGQSIHNFTLILGKFANDIRKLYGSDIREVASRDIRVGGSSTDAAKDNPIDWENIAGTHYLTKSGLIILEAMVVDTDLQRHLTDSKLGRFQPQGIMAAFYETLLRTNKALKTVSVNEDMMKEHLGHFKKMPSEAMVTILKSHGFRTEIYENSHEFIKNLSKDVKLNKGSLLKLAKEDETFMDLFENKLSKEQKKILKGDYNKYLGSAKTRTGMNTLEASKIIRGENDTFSRRK